jgi:hypothetical protein
MRATIPIWCAVINKIVLKRGNDRDIDRDRDFADYAPPWMIASHIDQIDSLLPSLIDAIPTNLIDLIRYTLSPILQVYLSMYLCIYLTI